MSTPLVELEQVLLQLIVEHQKLLIQLELQQASMKKLDIGAMENMAHAQETTRMRIATLETRRRLMVGQLAKALRLEGSPTISQLAEAIPAARSRLLGLREKLVEAINQVALRSHIAGRVAGAVLGHLNTAVRLLAGAVEHAGLYTKYGVPQMSARIGVMEAVG